MHRTQVLLEVKQYEALKIRARREERSLSELIRLAVDRWLGREKIKLYSFHLKDLCGLGKDPGGPSSSEHDRFLYK